MTTEAGLGGDSMDARIRRQLARQLRLTVKGVPESGDGGVWPPAVAPMLATARELPSSGRGYGWEWKYDGGRAVARVRPDGQVRLDSRNAKDFTPVFPEIATALTEALHGRWLTVDGELIAVDPATGVPDFARLQRRFGVHPSEALLAEVPVAYVVFDLLHLDDDSTMGLPYTERRRLLTDLKIEHPGLLVPPHQIDVDPHKLLEIARAHGIEGVVGKRLDSTYRPGRSPAWIKHALRNRIEVVVGGWTPGQGNRTDRLGSLLLGRPIPDDPTSLAFVGAVGTGWSMATADQLLRRLKTMPATDSPFSAPLAREYARHARYVTPELVGEVEYRSQTAEGYLRHPSWKGLRPDKTITDL
jgi:bifunctional non-homologous end joining protein LigD